MRIARVIVLVSLIGAASIAARQLIQRSRNVQAPIQVVSSVAISETGKYDLGDVALLENGDAWAVGYDGQHVDRLYFSNDRAKTWIPIEVPGTGFTMHAITFSDSQHGWAVGGNGLIVRTEDGGKNWELLKSPSQPDRNGLLPDLHALHFANARVGYVAGNERFGSKTSDEVWGSVELFCTKDGGDTWRQCFKESEPNTVFQIATVSESRAFVSLGDRLMRTDDQGETWQQIKLSAKYISSIAFAADGTGWLVGSHGVFQQSTDGGNTWQQPTSLTQEFVNRNWWSVAFNGSGIGLAVGDNGAFAFTTNNGNTWKLQTSIKSDHLRVVRMQDSRAVILGSQNAYSISVTPTPSQQARSK